MMFGLDRFFGKKGKAQGMSLNVVIVAAIVLIILVVLVLIFSGKLKFFGSQTSETSDSYSTSNCLNPAIDAECSSDKAGCESRGGMFVEKSEGWADCPSGSQCCRFI